MSQQTEKTVFEFRVHTPNLLKEIVEASIPRTHGVLFQPINIFRNLLCQVASRASKLDDPELNILMLNLMLYEVPDQEVVKYIDIQKERLKK